MPLVPQSAIIFPGRATYLFLGTARIFGDQNVDGPANLLSLCSGGGGLELGIGLVVPGSRTVCFVEREAYACAVLAARMAEGTLHEAPVWSDLRTFDGSKWRGLVDIVAAGFPCQPFSCAGRQLGEKDPRHLWPEVARIIGECDPHFVFLENVPNLVNLGFRQVRRDLRGLGYMVEAGLFSAAEVGATHLRKRIFVLAAKPAALADADCGGRGEEERGVLQGEPDPDRGGEGDVADPGRQRRQQESRSPHGDEGADEGRGTEGMYQPGRPVADVAYAAGTGREERGCFGKDDVKELQAPERDRGTLEVLANAECRGRRASRNEGNERRAGTLGATGKPVADPQGGGLGVLREPSRRDGLLDGGGEAMADALGAGICGGDQRGLGAQGRKVGQLADGKGPPDELGDGSQTMADAEYPFGGTEYEGDGETRGREGLGRCRPDMADSERNGLERGKPAGRTQAAMRRRPAEQGKEMVVGVPIPLFPPKPGDLEKWGEVLRDFPALEPSVRNMAHGLAPGMGVAFSGHRQDQLRLLGNGVLPACAALAFGVLLDRLVQGRGTKDIGEGEEGSGRSGGPVGMIAGMKPRLQKSGLQGKATEAVLWE